MLRRFVRGVLELFAPLRCAACAEPLTTDEPGFCGACGPLLEPAGSPGGEDGAGWVYGGPLADALHRFKYGRRLDVAAALVPLLEASVARLVGQVDVVTCVPLAGPRLRERGFNQSALLAQGAARVLGVPFRARMLARARGSPRQVGAGRRERARQLAGAFVAHGATGLRVLVVDDVRTTGATLDEARRALLADGAAAVLTRALAQTPDEG